MADETKIYVAGAGMMTPLGANVEMTAAAVRAEVSAYQEIDYFDKDYNKIKMATVPDAALENCLNEVLLKGALSAKLARMLQLASCALYELIPTLFDIGKIPLFLAGPEQINVNDCGINKQFLENIAGQTGVNIDLENSRIISTGRAGGLNTIQLAFRYFESSDQDYVLVGGVDTFYDKPVLDLLDSADRLLCGEAMDGFVPGEGAGFLLLTRSPELAAHYDERIVFLLEPGNGRETGHIMNEEPYRGEGLDQAFKQTLQHYTGPEIATICSSMNGENYWAKECGVALLRNKSYFQDPITIEHNADCYGDLGAATGIVLAGITSEKIKNGRSLAPSLIYCSSDREQRAAVVIHHQNTEF
jgi:3-oxoacyl-[acyl-carrier-protein] synthase-1